jgi:hypothetical protein
MSLRVYLDTSVFSVYHDTRIVDRQRETQEFWHGWTVSSPPRPN